MGKALNENIKELRIQCGLNQVEFAKEICVTYPNMTYLGIWHMPKTDAPYICIEPWSSLPSRKNVVEDLET